MDYFQFAKDTTETFRRAVTTSERQHRSRGRYCELCDKWFLSLRTKDCPQCGADTVPAATDPNAPEPAA
jgi:hypothetical protein